MADQIFSSIAQNTAVQLCAEIRAGVDRGWPRAFAHSCTVVKDDSGFTTAEREALIDSYPGAQGYWFIPGGYLSA
jgi:hypothetical protein